ncbi:uncharacterized protein LOC111372749 isoform X2 [Olea europaea var. sylvestris]|uniref:uncharacterized protein LOC111372749 isoform X2 n=1 Tax=Olea europaea var. sylvestris TaxID=158386 RepID=UPI000C1CD07A|nr:uncharacterized protein LOC111372749 isoform X2 [Olea europaea var. sylvestris]
MAFSTPTLFSLHSPPLKPSIPFLPMLPVKPYKYPHSILSFSSHRPFSQFTSEQAILEAVADADANEKSLPAVRTYENDLARLTLVGSVDFQQALTAAAADGGEAANEHVSAGVPAMVIETVFPGHGDEHSTVSTRLVPASFTLTSVDEEVSSAIAEVICLASLESTERNFYHYSTSSAPNKFFHWFSKPKQTVSQDSTVVLYNLLEHEVLANAKVLLEKFSAERAKYMLKEMKFKNSLLASPAYAELEKMGGSEFGAWISEYVPSYRLEIDVGKLRDVKFKGWSKSAKKVWEVILTHSQMVCLANILDMYYEDVYTLPDKKLSCHTIAKSSSLSPNKGSSLLKMFSIALAGGVFLVSISILGKFCLPYLPSGKRFIRENCLSQSSHISSVQHQSMDSCKLEAHCVSVIRRIKDSFGWPGEILTNSSHCAWTGELPIYLRKMDDIASNILSTSQLSEATDEEAKASLQDIASYQVVLSSDGSIRGFQPTSRVAVNHWAANPLAKELYGGKNLSPGLLEPGLKISHPSEVIVLELLMSVNPDSYFAFVRPIDIAGKVDV